MIRNFRYKLGTVKGQFIYACVIIVPLDHGSNKVFIDCKPELDEPLGHVRVSYVFSNKTFKINMYHKKNYNA